MPEKCLRSWNKYLGSKFFVEPSLSQLKARHEKVHLRGLYLWKTSKQQQQQKQVSSAYTWHKTGARVFWFLSSFAELEIPEAIFVGWEFLLPILQSPQPAPHSHLRGCIWLFFFSSSQLTVQHCAPISSCSNEFNSEWSEKHRCSARLHHPWIILHWGGGERR